MDITSILKNLCEKPGVAGCENAASEAVCKLLSSYMPNVSVDAFGTVTGSLISDENLPLLLLDAHIDEIGMIVNFIDDKGFLKVSRAGGIDRRVLPAQQVTVWGKRPVKGIVCTLPPHIQKDGEKAVKEEEIAIDIGFSKEEAEKIVSLGDCVTIDSVFTELKNGRVSSRALDDRAGVTAILYALDLLKDKKTRFNLAVSFSSQEELGCRGAKISAYNINPDIAVAVDVSYGDYTGCNTNKTGKLSNGVMIGISPALDRDLFIEMKQVATDKNIPFQIEVMGGDTGTNVDLISLSRAGVRCALLSIPERNMHMPVEVVQVSDIKSVGELIAGFIEG